MLKCLTTSRRDAWTHVLILDGTEIGWSTIRSLGFGGFADRAAARVAADLAAPVAAEWFVVRLQQRPPGWHTLVPYEDQVMVGPVVGGRIVAPGACPIGGGHSYGFELAVPEETWLAVRLQLAQQVHAAIASPQVPDPVAA